MKTVTTFLLLVCSVTLFSQQTISKNVGDFNELKVFDLMEVNLIQSNETKVVVKGEHTEDVKIINDNGVLKLRMNIDTRFRGEDTYIEVYFKNIDVIDANEGARIVGNTMIVQEEIELRSQEGGKIKVGLEVSNTEVKAVTGGIVEVSGRCDVQKIKINTGGIFEGKDFKTRRTEVRITAAGEAEVYATELVDANVTAGGDVTVYGNPEKIKEKKFAGGRITRIDY